MSVPEARVSIRLVQPVLAGLVMHGVDPGPVLTRVGIDPTLLADRQAQVPHGATVALWNEAVQATGLPTLGLRVAEAMDLSHFDVQSYAFLNAPTLGDGLSALARHHRLNHSASRLTLEKESGHVLFRHSLPGAHRLPAAAAQFVLAVAVLGARAATGSDRAVAEVRFQHASPADRADYDRVLDTVVRFRQPHNEVVFRESSLALPHREADPALRAILERHAEAMLAALPRHQDFVDRVRSLLAAELQGGNPSAEHIASRLTMSVRTLSRRLSAEGTTHRRLLESLRHDLAVRYLGDAELSIGEVAFLLGYSEPSAFHRAFRRWTGHTPSEARESP